MKKLKIFSFIYLALFGYSVCLAQSTSEGINYSVSVFKETGKKRKINKIYIEKVEIEKSPSVEKSQAQQINKRLENLYKELYIEARSCHDPSISNPWGYEVKFDQMHFVGDTLSIVFNTFTVCSGNPYVDKIARNFSASTGHELSPSMLIKKYAPSLYSNHREEGKTHWQPGEDAANTLMDKNENLLSSDLKDSCGDFYLKTIPYSIWVKDKNLMLLPILQQPYSHCHKEYSMQFETPVSDN